LTIPNGTDLPGPTPLSSASLSSGLDSKVGDNLGPHSIGRPPRDAQSDCVDRTMGMTRSALAIRRRVFEAGQPRIRALLLARLTPATLQSILRPVPRAICRLAALLHARVPLPDDVPGAEDIIASHSLYLGREARRTAFDVMIAAETHTSVSRRLEAPASDG